METLEGLLNGTACRQGEDFWDNLLGYVDEESIMPFVGPELLTVKRNGAEISLYRVIAEEILTKFGVPFRQQVEDVTPDKETSRAEVFLGKGREVSDAVCAIHIAGKKPFGDLYRPLYDILKAKTTEYQTELLTPLKKLASIRSFHLFVSTTWDGLLAKAIDEVCHGGEKRTEEILYALNLPGDRKRDLPPREDRGPAYTAVFYPFGKASPSPLYAIHEEDTLEFLYKLQLGLGSNPQHMLDEIRGKHLLFVGCPLADWLGRFLVRLSNTDRLYGERYKREFLVIDKTTADQALTGFLERFSQNTCFYVADARSFVDQLLQRWQERHPELYGETPGIEKEPSEAPALKGMIFISYASEDRSSALRFRKELEILAGNDIAWLDKGSGLTIGDDYARVIKRHITKDCKLFIPLISSNTERRHDGFFRKEWEWAAARDEGIQGRKFIMPLIIDPEAAAKEIDDLLIPDRFRSKHAEQAIEGHLSKDLRAQLAVEIQKLRGKSSR